MKYLKEKWSAILISLFLVVVGILLLVNPSQFASVVLKLAGAVLILRGLWDLIKYFRADALFLNARKKRLPRPPRSSSPADRRAEGQTGRARKAP